jgi:hypothetical protein
MDLPPVSTCPKSMIPSESILTIVYSSMFMEA